ERAAALFAALPDIIRQRELTNNNRDILTNLAQAYTDEKAVLAQKTAAYELKKHFNLLQSDLDAHLAALDQQFASANGGIHRFTQFANKAGIPQTVVNAIRDAHRKTDV